MLNTARRSLDTFFSLFCRASEKLNHSVIGLSNVQWTQSVKWKYPLPPHFHTWHVSFSSTTVLPLLFRYLILPDFTNFLSTTGDEFFMVRRCVKKKSNLLQKRINAYIIIYISWIWNKESLSIFEYDNFENCLITYYCALEI